MRSLVAVVLLCIASTFALAQDLKPKLKATATGVEVQLSCNGGTNDVNYNMYRAPATAATSSATCPSTGYIILGTSPMSSSCGWVDTTVTQGLNYCYAATGLNSLGQESAQSIPLFVVIPGAPTTPTNLQIVQIVAGSVKVKWSAPASDNVLSYRVLRKTGAAKEFGVIAYGVKQLSFTDKPGKGTFNYEVKDLTKSGQVSGPSNVVTAVLK